MSTAFVLRTGKIISVAGIGLMSLIIVISNITDYYSNYYFVEHVMKMDSIFPDSKIHYRSVNSPFLFTTMYLLIIAMQAFMCFSCLKGTWQMTAQRKAAAKLFHAAKKWSVIGLITGIVIWFIGFEVVGGEWFGMWQSAKWNGLYSADRVVTFIALVLILLQAGEAELTD